MTERDKKLVEQATKYALGLNPEEDAYGNPLNRDKFQRDRDARFADFIRADEREACAKLLENTDLGGLASDSKLQLWVAALLYEYAKAIRARGNT